MSYRDCAACKEAGTEPKEGKGIRVVFDSLFAWESAALTWVSSARASRLLGRWRTPAFQSASWRRGSPMAMLKY